MLTKPSSWALLAIFGGALAACGTPAQNELAPTVFQCNAEDGANAEVANWLCEFVLTGLPPETGCTFTLTVQEATPRRLLARLDETSVEGIAQRSATLGVKRSDGTPDVLFFGGLAQELLSDIKRDSRCFPL